MFAAGRRRLRTEVGSRRKTTRGVMKAIGKAARRQRKGPEEKERFYH